MESAVAIQSLDNVDNIRRGYMQGIERFDERLEFWRAGIRRIDGHERPGIAGIAGFDHDIFMRHHGGADLHVAAYDDAARPLVDYYSRRGLRLHDGQTEHLRDEQHGILAVLRGNEHFDVDLVERPGQRTPARLNAQPAVDQFRHVLGDLKVGVVLVQNQGNLSVFDEGVEKLLFQLAALENSAAIGDRRIIQGDGQTLEQPEQCGLGVGGIAFAHADTAELTH